MLELTLIFFRRLAFGMVTFFLMLDAGAAQLGSVNGLPDVVINIATGDALYGKVATDNGLYRYVLHNGSLAEMQDGCFSRNSPCIVPNVMHTLLSRRTFVSEEATRNRNILPNGVKWALFSDDKKHVVYSFEGIFGSGSLSLVVMQLDAQRIVYSLVDPEVTIDCIRWLPDLKSLAILDSKTRVSKTPLGIFAALSGHGIPIANYSLRIVSFDNNNKVSEERFPLPRSFKESVACLDMSE